MKKIRNLTVVAAVVLFVVPVIGRAQQADISQQYVLATTVLIQTPDVPLAPPYVVKQVSGVIKNRLLPPQPGNPRNSEGDFVQLRDGRVLFIYSHFTGGGSDHAAGHLASRVSSDGGRTWSKEDVVVLPQSGLFNDMSVSLLRLQNGNVALFYARKNSLLDCRAVMRISTDECETWGDPIECISDQVGYYVLNNDRVIQLRDGRLIMAVSLHNLESYEEPNWDGHVMCYISDDSGATWRRNKTILAPVDDNNKRLIAQEPGLVELKDGRLLMFIRSNAGSQLMSWSEDRGETWTTPIPSNIISPVSPATIERIPSTGDLLLVWNDHSKIDDARRGKRTPFKIAVSKDEGVTWSSVRTLEDDANGWYCYTAMDFIDGRVLLGHCAGDRRTGGLNLTQITHFPVEWLYRDSPDSQERR
jgi:sialidase-1